MKKKFKIQKTSMPLSIVFGILTSVIITVIGAVIMASLLSKESIGLEGMTVPTILVQLVASAAGAFLAASVVNSRQLIAGMASAVGYFLILLAGTAMFFDGEYSQVGIGALVILASAIGVMLIRMRGNKKPVHRKKIRTNR